MKKAFVFLLAVNICLLHSGSYLYADYYKDGGEHWLSSRVFSDIVVKNSSDGNKTILHFMDGAYIDSGKGILRIYGQSEVYMTGGTIPWSLIANNSSYAEVSGGSITIFTAWDEAEIVMFGGSATQISAQENSVVSLHGGRVSRAYSWDYGQLNIFGGSVPGLVLRGNSKMIIHGIDFAIDGIAVDYGVIDFSSREMSGWLTGTLLNGDFLSASFYAYDDAQLILVPEAATVSIDIKPQSCPNPLNVKSNGVLPVAILGVEDFDVNEIDPNSLEILGVSPLRNSFEDVAAPVAEEALPEDCLCSAEGPDGFMDLTLKFDTQEIIEAIGEIEDGEMIILTLTGLLQDGTPIEGTDCVLIKNKCKK